MGSINYAELGFVRVSAVAPQLALADPLANAEKATEHLAQAAAQGASVVVFPELSITGYSCEDLFFTQDLHSATRQALMAIASGLPTTD